MIINRENFTLNGKCLVERLIIKAPFKYEALFRDEACFLYFKKGRSEIYSAKEKIEVGNNEFIVLRCGSYLADIINSIPGGVCEIYAVHLYSDILNEIFKNEIPLFIKSIGASPERKLDGSKIDERKVSEAFIDSLQFYFDNPQLVNDELLLLKVKELIFLLLQTGCEKSITNLFLDLFTPKMATIKEILNVHQYSNLSVEELANLAGQSISTFKRYFQAQFNDTPANYIRNLKLKKAAELLKISDYSISEICYKVGFNESSHFSDSFKKKFKLSPFEYRQREKLE